MKQALLSRIFLMVILCTGCMSACSATGVISPGAISGEWHATESHPQQGDIDTVFIINADGTFSGSLSVNSEPAWQYSGTWELEGNRITWEYLKSSIILLQEDKADIDEILSVTDDTLTYRSLRRGTVSTLQRVR
jgi:hypothetical protein